MVSTVTAWFLHACEAQLERPSGQGLGRVSLQNGLSRECSCCLDGPGDPVLSCCLPSRGLCPTPHGPRETLSPPCASSLGKQWDQRSLSKRQWQRSGLGLTATQDRGYCPISSWRTAEGGWGCTLWLQFWLLTQTHGLTASREC